VKGLSSYFSKIKKKFEVGQLHAFGGFLTENNRENLKYTIRKKAPNSFSEVAQLQNLKIFSLLLYDVYTGRLILF
jgi:hypothetical protein